MFGYLVASPECLTEDDFARYQACYCGLCRSLGKRYNQAARLTLTYDMTFLVLLLNSLYEPEESSGHSRCLRHPRTGRDWWQSEITDYAVDMNLALAYYKCLDDWEDDSSLPARAEAGLLKSAMTEIRARWPRQCEAMQKSIRELHEVEKLGGYHPDEAAACFGTLMAEIFVLKDDRWQQALRCMGNALGRFIYLLDAALDLDKDTRKNSYNPFRRYYGCADNEQRFREILQMTLGDCIAAFDYLPLVQDTDILKSVLCAGLWTEFERKFCPEKAKEKRKENEGTHSA